MKKIIYIKHLVLLIPLILISCCKYDYNYLDVTNKTDKDRFLIVYGIEDNERYIVSCMETMNEEFYRLKANGNTRIMFTGGESLPLEKEPNEKNIILIFYDSVSDLKNESSKSTIVKKYSFQELEDRDWKIDFNGN